MGKTVIFRVMETQKWHMSADSVGRGISEREQWLLSALLSGRKLPTVLLP